MLRTLCPTHLPLDKSVDVVGVVSPPFEAEGADPGGPLCDWLSFLAFSANLEAPILASAGFRILIRFQLATIVGSAAVVGAVAPNH